MHIDFFKHTIVNVGKSLTFGMKKPDKKFLCTLFTSMLEIRTPVLSRLGDVRKMDARHLLKYFSRNMEKEIFADLPQKVEKQMVKIAKKSGVGGSELPSDACFCFDSVDLNKYSAKKMEGLSLVRDGSTGHIVHGYVLNAVSVCGIPLMMEREKLTEVQTDDSGNEQVVSLTTRYDIFDSQVAKIKKHFGPGYWILADRLYDDVKKYNLLMTQGFKFAIRMKNTRNVKILAVKGVGTGTGTDSPDTSHDLNDLIGKTLKIGEIPEGYYEITFTDLQQPCFLMVKQREGYKNPIRVLSNEDDSGMILQYVRRWEIERIFKSGKQEYDCESIGVQSEQKIDILIAIIQLCLGISAYTFNTIEGQGSEKRGRKTGQTKYCGISAPQQKATISTSNFRKKLKTYLKQVSLTFNRNSLIGFIARYMRTLGRMKYVQRRVTLKGDYSAQLSLPW